ncbi:MAG TPA: Ppx/GppA phosphatase family protein [Conexibacter sp.]|nr:Ppx/GppA phosphatase family protein [Conexibacter sp.]
MHVGVVDIGTNSTRLLIADVEDGAITELDRRSQVTRLGQGVDTSGSLAEEAMVRVFATLDAYRDALDAADVPADARVAVLTSAARDATNGADFTRRVRDDYGLDARTIAGEEEAELTFRGATHGRDPQDTTPLLVVDIGGGSTELIVGAAGSTEPSFHVSLQAGVVRQTERHLHHDPPPPHELQQLADDVRATIEAGVPREVRASARAAVGVAGTATSLAAIDQELDPYDPRRVHGYVLELGEVELLLARLAQMPLAQRRDVRGLHPDRAPTIVAGAAILLEVLRAFELDRAEVSEHDLLHGVALTHTRPHAH